jgi:hypothetical protein
MEPSPSRSTMPPLLPFGTPYTPTSEVDLGCLARPPEGITPFTVARPRSAPATEGGGSPAVESLAWCTIDLTISDRSGTPDPPSPMPDTMNPNLNGSGSGSPARISPLGNQVIRQVTRLTPSTQTQPAALTDACPSDLMVWRVWFRL